MLQGRVVGGWGGRVRFDHDLESHFGVWMGVYETGRGWCGVGLGAWRKMSGEC